MSCADRVNCIRVSGSLILFVNCFFLRVTFIITGYVSLVMSSLQCLLDEWIGNGFGFNVGDGVFRLLIILNDKLSKYY